MNVLKIIPLYTYLPGKRASMICRCHFSTTHFVPSSADRSSALTLLASTKTAHIMETRN